ncbi:Renal dipeptidase [Ammoniphilus oxalaticus]|uniref:Renal dipeptidase n=1 Tax=Ammoniphilus oxalaticus TaxID=66863 RepID=A0A419SHC1_9BACL|nr:nucleotidyltransferase family protein [Ammoniphilus oxalaticus]RKD23182.1 Renal dipeptidase [Ammoniphilus oxalaticus]
MEGISKELEFLFQLIGTDWRSNLERMELGEIDEEHFLELARHHRVYPILYHRLKSSSAQTSVSVLRRLEQKYQFNTFEMLRQSGLMERFARIFNEHNIRVLFLKGPILGADLYGDISLRTSGDVDLLIEVQHLEKAEQLLIDAGYEKDEYIKTVLNDWKWRHHHLTFFDESKKSKIEVHWRLHPGPTKEPSFGELWKRKRKSEITKYPLYFLGREHLFYFLVTHGARHGWSRLRWLMDIERLAQQDLDWIELQVILRKYWSEDVAGQALVLANKHLGLPLGHQMEPLVHGQRPKQLAKGAFYYMKQMINLHTEPLPEDVSTYHKQHMFALMSTQQKLLFMLSCLYPYPEDAETLPLPKPIHFLYFPLRPLLCVYRRIKV